METKRRKRSSVDGARDILTVSNQDPNFVYRWIADDPQRPGRVERLKEFGYEIVTEDLEVGQKAVDRNSKMGSAITRLGGGGITLVLMRQRKDWYDEDQKAKQTRVDAVEATMRDEIRRGHIPGSQEPGVGGKLEIKRG